MTSLIAFVAAAAVVAAVYLLITAFTAPSKPRARRRTPAQQWAALTRRPPGAAGRRRDILWLVSLAAGVATFLLTGYLVAIVLVPLAIMVAPKLLGQAPPTDLPLLEALDRWVRAVASAQMVGRDVIGSLRSARGSTPPLLADEVQALLDRIEFGWTPAEAIQRMADDLDSPEADAVLASLKVALNRTEGVHATLIQISDAIQERIRVARTIEVERNRPRTTARIVTVLTVLMLTVTLLFAPAYMAPYKSTALGQLLLAGLVSAYVGSLLLMYRSTRQRHRARILIVDANEQGGRP